MLHKLEETEEEKQENNDNPIWKGLDKFKDN
jgi:hypothetical protein